MGSLLLNDDMPVAVVSCIVVEIIFLLITSSSLRGKSVFLVAATLRPETMYGQTNCWIHPDITYIAFNTTTEGGEVFISTRRSALNMSYQGFTKEEGKLDIILEIVGQVCNNMSLFLLVKKK